jgi:hypothetical protein
MSAYESGVALQDYLPNGPNEIALKKGDRIAIRSINSNAHRVEGENPNGDVGWFPEEAIRLTHHVNAFDFLAMSLGDSATPRSTTPRLEATKKATVNLSAFLSEGMPKKIALDKKILEQTCSSEEIKNAQDHLLKEKEAKRNKYEKFIQERIDALSGKSKKKILMDLPENQCDEIAIALLKLPLDQKRMGIAGADILKWAQDNRHASNKNDSQSFAQFLLYRHIIYDVSEKTATKFNAKEFYNLSCRTIEYTILNVDKLWGDDDPGDSLSLSIELLTKLIRYVDAMNLNFPAMRSDPKFLQIGFDLCALQKCNMDSLTYGSKEAFWLNVYNIMVLYTHCRLAPPNSRSDRQLLADKCQFCVGRGIFSLSEVHQNVLLGSSIFPSKDKRATMVVGEADKKRKALFTFGLPDGTTAAPGFYVYQPQDFELKLKESAMVFFESVEVDSNDLKVKCPRFIRNLSKDFGFSDDDILKMLLDWLIPPKAKIVREQPGFELEVESTSTSDPVYTLDASVLNPS